MCPVMFCSGMLCAVMLCSVVACYVLDVSVMLCSFHFCHVRRKRGGREARGTTGGPGDLAAAVCRVGGSGGLLFKSNNPKLPGRE